MSQGMFLVVTLLFFTGILGGWDGGVTRVGYGKEAYIDIHQGVESVIFRHGGIFLLADVPDSVEV